MSLITLGDRISVFFRYSVEELEESKGCNSALGKGDSRFQKFKNGEALDSMIKTKKVFNNVRDILAGFGLMVTGLILMMALPGPGSLAGFPVYLGGSALVGRGLGRLVFESEERPPPDLSKVSF